MRDGTLKGRKFPELSWDDVDWLIAQADSDEILTRFPVNPFSSQSQNRCSVGILSMWFVEGLRRGEPMGFPSLNPLCFETGYRTGDWFEASEANRDVAARAYRKWWDEVKDAPIGVRRSMNPLHGTGLYWY